MEKEKEEKKEKGKGERKAEMKGWGEEYGRRQKPRGKSSENWSLMNDVYLNSYCNVPQRCLWADFMLQPICHDPIR